MWMRSDAATLAHWFGPSGSSACHRWAQTTLDHEDATAPRCPSCSELVERGAVEGSWRCSSSR